MAYYQHDAGFRSWESFRRRVDYPKQYPTEIEDPEPEIEDPNENEDY